MAAPTREEIEKMPAGRELDMLISERIIGAATKYINYTEEYWERREDRSWEPLPYYSADIAAAKQVQSHFAAQGWAVQIYQGDARLPFLVILERFDFPARRECRAHGQGETESLAICRAALIALLESVPAPTSTK